MTEVTRKPEGEVTARRKRRPRGRPKGLRIHVQQTEQITAICTRLKLEGPILNFREVAEAVSKRSGIRVGLGTIHRFSKGIEPLRAGPRKALGLPPLLPAVACPTCGVVHVAKRCPRTVKKAGPSAPPLPPRAGAVDPYP